MDVNGEVKLFLFFFWRGRVEGGSGWVLSGWMRTEKRRFCENSRKTSSPKGNDAHLRAIIQSEKNGNINFSDA